MFVLKYFSSCILFCLLLSLFGCSSNESSVTIEEQMRDDETLQTEESIRNFTKIVEKNKITHVGRGAHAKGHSCIKAYFQVRKDIETKYQHGIFSVPGKVYKSWIRFSNANSSYAKSHDANKDAHGMAIKLIGVEDKAFTTALASGQSTQDFLMADNPEFFSPSIDEYNRFLSSKSYVNFFFEGINPFHWRIREFFIALETLKKPPSSPLWPQYYSNTAYKLGPHNIKFSAKSCKIGEAKYSPEENDPDFMRKNLVKELYNGEGCFDFMVQLQVPDKNMSIEDPSIEWKESDSPFVTLADITILAQGFDSPEHMQFCENLSFSPWHALAEHRPIGQFNRIRKAVYKASSDYRHTQNKTDIPQSLEW